VRKQEKIEYSESCIFCEKTVYPNPGKTLETVLFPTVHAAFPILRKNDASHFNGKSFSVMISFYTIRKGFAGSLVV
jgi:galactose-1-phosphate uridylyltransferase